MQQPLFSWPSKEDYDQAMNDSVHTIQDENLKNGSVKQDQTGMLSYGGAGLYVALYHIDKWMVRCFCKTSQREPPHDICERYKRIDAFIQRLQDVPALVPIQYVDQGIKVEYLDRDTYVLTDTKILPFIKMPFIYGRSLGNFIYLNHLNKERMNALCRAWLELIYTLERKSIAHGDLDLTNVIVTQDRRANITLKIIDYDNMWIPALAHGYEQTEGGHEHFQHPAFNSKSARPFNAQMDRFSALVIYISLKALSQYPDLYEELRADDTHRLLFAKDDYKAETKGIPNHITRLKEKHITELDALLVELSASLKEKRVPASLQDFDLGDAVNQGTNRRLLPDPPVLPIRPVKPPAPVLHPTEIEEVFYAWERLEEKTKPAALPPMWHQRETEPEREVAQQIQEQQYAWEESTERVSSTRSHFVRNVLIVSIIIVCLIVGLILLLLATHIIAFSPATFYHASFHHPGLIQHEPYTSPPAVSTLPSHSGRL